MSGSEIVLNLEALGVGTESNSNGDAWADRSGRFIWDVLDARAQANLSPVGHVAED